VKLERRRVMKNLLLIMCLTLCDVAFCESEKYLVLTDGNKEVFCESLEVTDTGYSVVVNGEKRNYKFSEATLKMKASASTQPSYNPDPIPEPKKVAADNPKEEPKKTTYSRNGKEEPLNKWVQDYPGSKTVHMRTT